MTAEGDKHLAIILGLRAILSNKNVPRRNILYIYIYIYIEREIERERDRERCDRSEESILPFKSANYVDPKI